MNYSIIRKLPPIEELIQTYPISSKALQRIRRDRQEVKNILEGKDSRLLLIIGPCSAWPKEAVLNYAKKLLELNNEVRHALKLVMRVYTQKPRTAKGWMGPLGQPNPLLLPDVLAGLQYTRDMMVKIVELGLPIADEILFTHNAKGFLALLSWAAIGARSSEDQEHRIFASGLDCAIGMKNPLHGLLHIAVNSLIVAQHSHTAVLNGYEVQTHGNLHAHLVLRGDCHGPNYSIEHLTKVKQLMDLHCIKNPSVIIDSSHDNCVINGKKNHRLQPAIILEILENLKDKIELKKIVKGFMVESFLKNGSQKINERDPQNIDYEGLSITDPCLNFQETESFVLELAKRMVS